MVCDCCYFILTIAGLTCVKSDCTKGQMKRSNKYIREILEELRITCYACNTNGLSYKQYLEHIEKCTEYAQTPIQIMMREIRKKEEKIKEIRSCIKDGIDDMVNSEENIKKLREKYLTNKLNGADKMSLYEATIKNDVQAFKSYIEKFRFPMFEEVSAAGCFWSPLHYAMHYGKVDIIEYILDYAIKNNIFNDVMRLQSNDGRNPILCLLKSCALDKEKKKEILKKLIGKYPIKMIPKIRKDLSSRGMENLLN